MMPGRWVGEHELTAGLLSKNASFRLIVGELGVKAIELLIRKLEDDGKATD